MIKLLVPLGLLGLLGVVALIVIYIIRPNYQTKHLSSTYIWKLSLKYRRKRIPTSRIRNLLIFLCQLLVLTIAAGILSMPAIVHENETDDSDIIVILDSSASMYAGFDGDTRFLRAVEEVTELSDRVLREGGYVSVILADNEASFLARRVSLNQSTKLMDKLDNLMLNDMSCSYGTANIENAMLLCEEVLQQNSSATIYFYTDTKYDYVPDNIRVVSVAQPDEWNVAILNAHTEHDDVYYSLYVDVVCYGRDLEFDLNVQISGANAADASQSGIKIPLSQHVLCSADTVKTIIFRYGGGENTDNIIFRDLGIDERFFSYQSIHVAIDEDVALEDAFWADNSFDIYGGQKEVLKVQYASTNPNIFFTGALLTLKNALCDQWHLQITDVKKGETGATEGFDFYIFEHMVPAMMPSDGVVFFVDPDTSCPQGGFTVRRTNDLVGKSVYLTSENDNHPVMRNILADDIAVSKYMMLNVFDSRYKTLMTCDANPILAVQKTPELQAAILAFSVHYSNIVEKIEFYLLIRNMFNYFLPATVEGYAYEVGESIALNSRGPKLNLFRDGMDFDSQEFTNLPTTVNLYIPGTYTLRGSTYFNSYEPVTNIFVKIPTIESNIQRTDVSLPDPYAIVQLTTWYDDLLIYLAAAVVALLFVEWLMQMHENK